MFFGVERSGGREEHSVLEGQVVGLGRLGEGGAGCVWGDFNGASSGEKTSNLCKFRFVIFRIILVS